MPDLNRWSKQAEGGRERRNTLQVFRERWAVRAPEARARKIFHAAIISSGVACG